MRQGLDAAHELYKQAVQDLAGCSAAEALVLTVLQHDGWLRWSYKGWIVENPFIGPIPIDMETIASLQQAGRISSAHVR